MAKTAVKELSEIALVLKGSMTPETARKRVKEDAEWFGQHADERTKVDRKVADRMLDIATAARTMGVNARTFGWEAGLLRNKDGKPDKMGNPTGTVTLAYNAAGVVNLAEQHDKDEIADGLRKAWNTLPDRKLSGRNGEIQRHKELLKAAGIGVRKVADRSLSAAGYALRFIDKMYAKLSQLSAGASVKDGMRVIQGCNALDLMRRKIAGDTVSESDVKFAVTDQATAAESATVRTARSASSPRRGTGRRAAAAMEETRQQATG